jgi:hypothetical protein
MLKVIRYFLWLVVVSALVLGFDQLMLKVPLQTPGLKEIQIFYVDFRSRLFGLTAQEDSTNEDRIEKMINQSAHQDVSQATHPNRYLYVDENGDLQFADSLQQVPVKYRSNAQPLAE